jgi:hypothetical protein
MEICLERLNRDEAVGVRERGVIATPCLRII